MTYADMSRIGPTPVDEYQKALIHAEGIADRLVTLLPDDAPKDMLRPMLVQQAGLMIAQYGPETVEQFVQAMGRAAAHMQAGNQEEAAQELAPFGMDLAMVHSMMGQPLPCQVDERV